VAINSIIGHHGGKLLYYQGFHDVVGVVLLVVGADTKMVCALSSRIAESFLIDAMATRSFEPVVDSLQRLFPLVRVLDAEVAAALDASGVDPLCALSWVITWFAHDVAPHLAERFFDAFLCSHPSFCLYAAAALIARDRAAVLACEPEFSAMHALIQGLPRNPALSLADVDAVLADAGALMRRLPPRHLGAGLKGMRSPNRLPDANAAANAASGAWFPRMLRAELPSCTADATAAADSTLLLQRRSRQGQRTTKPSGLARVVHEGAAVSTPAAVVGTTSAGARTARRDSSATLRSYRRRARAAESTKPRPQSAWKSPRLAVQSALVIAAALIAAWALAFDKRRPLSFRGWDFHF
jgi:hypothetical protein